MKATRVMLPILVILTVAFGSLSAIEFVQTAKTPPLTTTVTATTTAMATQQVAATTVTQIEKVIINGSLNVAFLNFDQNGSGVRSDVRNLGSSPLSIESVLVNGITAYFNGSGGILLSATQDPVPPGGTSTIEVASRNGTNLFCASPGTIDFTIVANQGERVTDHVVFYQCGLQPVSTTTTTNTLLTVNGISLQSFSLCPSNCTYPSPYLTGEIYFSGPSLCESLELFVNGTDEGSVGHGIGSTNVIYLYKGSFQSPAAVAGDVYVIKFVAVFVDNSMATATTTLVAGR
jgi:hypothetical protein